MALAPVLLGSKNPLFLNYARLIDKTVREFRALATDWEYAVAAISFCLSRNCHSPHTLTTSRGYGLTLIMIDEGHSLRKPHWRALPTLASLSKAAHPRS